MNYYNDNDPAAVATLRELMEMKLIPRGEIDDRSIVDVKPNELVGYRQCHFFAGCGGWVEALRLAGWGDVENVWSGSAPCFPAGTLIFTETGQVPIEDIRAGDKVLTHEGRFCKVKNIGNRQAEVLKLKGQGHWGLVVTADHPIYARPSYRDYKRTSAYYAKKLLRHPEWIKAKDMKGISWANIAFVPEMKMPILPEKNWFGKEPNIPSDLQGEGFAKFLGYWVGDGWTVGGERVVICGGYGDKELLLTLIKDAGLRCSYQRTRTGCKIFIGSKLLAQWLDIWFGRGAKNKKIPAWLHGQSKEFRQAFLVGLMLADGHNEKAAKGSGRINSISTISRSLAIGIRILMNQAGRSASIIQRLPRNNFKIEGRLVTERECYKVVEYEAARSFRFDGKYGWGMVRSVETIKTATTVYNIEVEDDHTYIADGIVVHNCPPFSQAGKKKSCPNCEGRNLIAHPFETGVFVCCACGHEWFADARHLWPEFLRLIRERKPAFVFGEQVAGTDGEVWLAGVRATLEREGYGAWGSDLCAAGVGSAQIRQRLFWVGFTPGARPHAGGIGARLEKRTEQSTWEKCETVKRNCDAFNVAGADGGKPENGEIQSIGQYGFVAQDGGVDVRMASAESARRGMVESAHERACGGEVNTFANAGAGRAFDLADNAGERCHGRQDSAGAHGRDFVEAGCGMVRADGARSQSREHAAEAAGYGGAAESTSDDAHNMGRAARNDKYGQWEPGASNGRHGEDRGSSAGGGNSIANPWADFELVPCQDACVRRIETGTFPLVSAGVDEKTTRYQLARMLRRLVPGRNIRERRSNARRIAENVVFAQTRRTESAAQSMVDGVSTGMVRGDDSGISQTEWEEAQASAEGRVIRLRAYGNAIVPWLAAEFVMAFHEGLEAISQQG